MAVFTSNQESLLRAQCAESRDALAGRGGRQDHQMPPVVEVTYESAIYLLSELDDDDCLFGICDLEDAAPKLGNVLLSTLEEKAMNDSSFHCVSIPLRPMTLADYLEIAQSKGRLSA